MKVANTLQNEENAIRQLALFMQQVHEQEHEQWTNNAGVTLDESDAARYNAQKARQDQHCETWKVELYTINTHLNNLWEESQEQQQLHNAKTLTETLE